MMHRSLLDLVRSACRANSHGDADAALLERFARTRDEAAFAELVHRHGNMVYGVSKRCLASEHDAEDCFQAAFLTLARKADSIRVGQALAGWLFRVTRHLALRMREQNAARGQTVALEDVAMTDTSPQSAELRELLAAELERLPEKYATPLVLHYLEGKTLEETARQLGWKQGTVSGRISRALARLRSRLERRGVTLSAAALTGLASEAPAPALAATTTYAVVAFLAGDVSALTPQVVQLSNGVLTVMTALKTKLLAGVLAVFVCAGLGIGMAVVKATSDANPPDSPTTEQQAEPAEVAELPAKAAEPAAKPSDLPGGAIARLGTRRGQTLADLASAVTAAAYSPDGKIIATTLGYHGITLWDAESGEKLGHVPMKKPEEYNIGAHLYGLSFSPDGKQIAWGGNDGVAVFGVSDVATGQRLWRIEGGNKVVFTPDGKYVIGGSYGGAPLVVEAATGKVVHRLAEKGWTAIRFAVSHDGKTVAVGVEHARDPREVATIPPRIEVWDVTTGRLRKHFSYEKRGYPGLQSVALSQDGKIVAYGEHDRITLVDTETGKELRRLENSPEVQWDTIQSPPDGKELLVFRARYHPESAGHPTTIHLLDAITGKELRYFDGASQQFGEAVFSPDGKRMMSYASASPIKVWDVATGRVLPAYDGHRAIPSLLAMDEEGKTMVSGDHLHCVCVWDVLGQKLKRRLDVGAVRGIDLSADGWSMLVTTQNSEVMLFDLANNSSRRLLTQTWQAKRAPDGKHAACVRFDRSIDIIDMKTAKPVQKCVGHHGDLHSLSFSRDGSRLLSASRTQPDRGKSLGEGPPLVIVADDTLRLWDVEKGKQIYQWNLASESAVLSPDGRTAFACDDQGAVRRFDTATGKELPPLLGHQAAVRKIVISRDGQRLASFDDVGGILLWDTTTGKELRRITVAEWGGAIELSSDGRRLATSCWDTTILLWDAAPGK